MNKGLACGFFSLALLISFCWGHANGAEGSFDVFNAATLVEDGGQFYSTNKWTERTRITNGSRRESNSLKKKKNDYRNTLGFNYSFAKAMQFGIFVPLIERRYKVDALTEGTLSGLGDITVYGKYMFVKNNWQKGSVTAAGILAFDLPAGEQGATKSGQRLPDSVQLGGGAINTTFGLSTGFELDKFGVGLLALHTVKPAGVHHLNSGNSTQVGLTMKYRFYQKPFPGSSGNLRWGVTYEHADKSEKRGGKLPNSGGNIWEGKIGWVHHPTPATDLTLFFNKPFRYRLHGTQLAKDHSVELALGWRF